MARRRRKTRTHVKPPTEQEMAGANPEYVKIPKSFVIKSGKVDTLVSQLVTDFRKVMEPHTASKLAERKNNRLKDYLSVAGQLGVTHIGSFSQTQVSTNLRLARFPKGPTLNFKVVAYSLMRDIHSFQSNPVNYGLQYTNSAIVVLNNIKGSKQMDLVANYIQNMFPRIDVANMKLSDARRVVLFSLDKEQDLIEFRHYSINVKPAGVSRSVKRLVQSKIPDLDNLQDISQYILNDTTQLDSEGEDVADKTVTLKQDYVGKSKKSSKQSINLIESGPRMTLELVKIETGFANGQVLYHKFISKSEEEIREQTQRKKKEAKEKQKRRKEQEENIQKKKAAKLDLTKRNVAHQLNVEVQMESDGEGLSLEEEMEPEFESSGSEIELVEEGDSDSDSKASDDDSEDDSIDNDSSEDGESSEDGSLENTSSEENSVEDNSDDSSSDSSK